MQSDSQAILDLLDSLVPDDEQTTITDVGGHPYTVQARASMARQVQVGRVFKAAMSSGLGDRIRGAAEGGQRAIVMAVVAWAIDDDAAQGMLDAAFDAAFPGTLRDAHAANPDEGTRARDLFPAEEIAMALLPFCARPAKRLAVGMAGTARHLGALENGKRPLET